MRIVIALGGNTFLGRGEPPTSETQLYNIRRAARSLAALAREHTLIVTHGNGPQLGMLALLAAEAHAVPYPLDVLGAETEGMIGYLLEQELSNELGNTNVATLLTRTVVRTDDPAFLAPTKFIGPVYQKADADRIAKERGWRFARDGQSWRRLVASPEPIDIVEVPAIECLSRAGFLVICAGGGGVPVHRTFSGQFAGIEGSVDKDLASELLARRLGVDCLMLLTDVPAVFDGWGSGTARRIRCVHPDALAKFTFPARSMGPKVEAARRFATHTGGAAYIGALGDAAAILKFDAGTRVSTDIEGACFETPLVAVAEYA
jgi:carbamate kinase